MCLSPSVDPAQFFSPLNSHSVFALVCVSCTGAHARGFVFQCNLYAACSSFFSCCYADVQSPSTWTRYSCKVPTCSFHPLSPLQGTAAAQRVSSGVSLAWNPAGRGLTGLSVLAATCYLPDNALTHTTMLTSHCAFSAFLLKVWLLYRHNHKCSSRDDKRILSDYRFIDQYGNENNTTFSQDFIAPLIKARTQLI